MRLISAKSGVQVPSCPLEDQLLRFTKFPALIVRLLEVLSSQPLLMIIFLLTTKYFTHYLLLMMVLLGGNLAEPS